MDYQKYIYEYILLFLYIYSYILISVFETKYYGWWLLAFTQFIFFAYFLTSFYMRAFEPIFYFLLIGSGLTMSALFLLMSKMQTYYRDDPSTSLPKKILTIPGKKQALLDRFLDFVIGTMSLLFFIFLVFKIGEVKHMSPFYIDRKNEYEYTPLKMIHFNQFTYFWEYCIPWLSGMSQIAILGLSPYLIFLAHEF